jgi:hypothetical protein
MEVKLNDKFNKLYNSKIYIDKDNLILELESKSTKYSKKFNLMNYKKCIDILDNHLIWN